MPEPVSSPILSHQTDGTVAEWKGEVGGQDAKLMRRLGGMWVWQYGRVPGQQNQNEANK